MNLLTIEHMTIAVVKSIVQINGQVFGPIHCGAG